MGLSLLYPLVYEAVETFVRNTGASSCWLKGVPRFDFVQAGLPDFEQHRQLVFEFPPSGSLVVWVDSDEVEQRVRAEIDALIERLHQLVPRASTVPPKPSGPPN